MFYINANGMHISRGDSADITTTPKIIAENGEPETVTLDENACVIFTVKSKYSGNLLIKRILTKKNYSDGVLAFSIRTSETNVEPYGYEYSYMYVPDRNDLSRAQTYERGDFEILPSVSKVDDLGGPETTEQYTKNEVNKLLENKADTNSVYDKANIDSKLSEKADSSDVDSKLSQKADTSEVYSKSEIDSKLAEKAGTSDGYTKSQTDTLLSEKANSSDVYKKSEIDNALSDKANSADVYTKTETDSAVAGKIAEIVAGAPEDFDTLKEMSDWIASHEGSAAAMNTAIQQNAADIAAHSGNTVMHVTASEKAVWNDKYSKAEIDSKIGNIQTILASIVEV